MTLSKFLTKLHHTRDQWDEALAQIDPSRMNDLLEGNYTVKDVIAHVTWYERENIGIIRQKALIGSPYWDLPTVDDRNAAIYADIHNLPALDVLTQSREVYQQLLAALATLTEADLNDASHFKDMPSDWVPAEVLASNCYEHYEQHLPTLRAWLNKP